MTSPCKASQPFFVESKKGNSGRLQCKLIQFQIREKQSKVFKLRFELSPSSKDDSKEPSNLSLIIPPIKAINATNFIMVYINITFYVKIGLFLYLDNLEQTVAPYQGQVKTSIDTLKRNFDNIFKMYKNHRRKPL